MHKHKLKLPSPFGLKKFMPEALFAVAIAAMGYTFGLSGGKLAALLPAQLLLIVLPFFLILMTGRSAMSLTSLLAWAWFSSILLVTIVVNLNNYDVSGESSVVFAVGHVMGLIGLIFALQWATRNLRIINVLRLLSILLVPLISIAIVNSALSFATLSRSEPLGIHPNWWGELGFAFVATSLTLRKRMTSALFIAVAFVLFFLVQSRGAALAAVVVIACYGLLSTQKSLNLRRALLVPIFACASIPFALFALYSNQPLYDFLIDRVLLLNDPNRGLGTGFTGRTEGWKYALEVFASNPVFGTGIDTLREVHNGFLQVAAQGGVVLLLPLTLWILAAITRSWKKQNYLALSILAGYIVYAMTYPRILNMNIASVLFYMSLFPWSAAQIWPQMMRSRNTAHNASREHYTVRVTHKNSRSRRTRMDNRRKSKDG